VPKEPVNPSSGVPMMWTRASALRTLLRGWMASVPVVLLAAIAIAATPRARGLSYFPALRFAVVAPVCVLVVLAAAFIYRALAARPCRPRLRLAAVVSGGALLLLVGMALVGPPGLAAAGAPAAMVVAAAVALLVPRFIERVPLSRAGAVVVVLVGALEAAGVVAALASEPVAHPGPPGLAFDIPRSMFDVEHRFVELPSGARVHDVDEGQGETLLFLHGNPSWSFQWRDLIHGLRGSYRCVALDFPGFGWSRAPAGFGFTPREESQILEEFVERLRLRNVTLVMQDWGGPIGIALAERRPELVRRVVLGSTWAWRTSASEPRGKWSVVAVGPVGQFVQANFNGIAAFALKDSRNSARSTPQTRPRVRACPDRPLRILKHLKDLESGAETQLPAQTGEHLTLIGWAGDEALRAGACTVP
jgi:pimeloyl-ACP methyl ester carboxylesterase